MENPTATNVIPFPPASQDNEPKTDQAKVEAERIANLKKSQKELTKIQKDLEILIDAMAENPSILSRASAFWGNLPLWQKIVAGTVLIAPPLVLGIFAQLLVCIVISVCTLVAYVSGSVVLDDHYTHSKNNTKNIKTGVLSLAEGLEVIMNSLKEIGSALAEQIVLFEKENEEFSKHIDSFKNQNQELSTEIDKLKETELKLRDTEAALEETCRILKAKVGEQTSLLEENQTALSKVKIDFERNQKELQEKIAELNDVRKQFATEAEKQQKISEALRAALNGFAETMDASEAEKAIFQQKLTDFMTNKEASFLSIINRFGAAEEDLVKVRARLKQVTEQYEQQVIRGDAQIARLEKVHLDTDSASSLGQFGLYATNKGIPGTAPTSSLAPSL